MKYALAFLLSVVTLGVVGCGQDKLPDVSTNKEKAYLKPGDKVRDVMVKIDK